MQMQQTSDEDDSDFFCFKAPSSIQSHICT